MKTEVVLKDAWKRFTLDQDKILLPEETVRRFKEKTEDLGIRLLDHTRRIDNGRLDIPVYFSMCGHEAEEIIGTKKQMGKGATPSQAEASAVMELAERYSFFSFCKDPENFVVDKLANIKDKAISFDQIARSVHDSSEDLPVTQKIFEDLPLKWTAAYNMTRDQEVLIPFNWFYAINEFNGPSAGNCVEEAISQGICEIVERHVSSLISRNRVQVPSINAHSPNDKMVVEMLGKYENGGIRLFISDFTLDMGIPTVGVMAYDPATFPHQSEIVWTAGTTPDPQKALSRALTEVAQLAGDFNSCSNYVASGLPKIKRIEDAPFITRPANEVDITDLPDLSHDNIKTEVIRCISELEKRDMDVIVVNTMNPLLEIPAFYTVIPGAHFRERAQGTSVGMFSCKLIAEEREPQEAISELIRIETRLPGKYYIAFYLGFCFLSMGDPHTALGYFQKSLDLDPIDQDIPSIYSYTGVCLKEMAQYRDALEVLKKGEVLDRERTDIPNLMGFCHFKLGEHEEAIGSFKKVLELDPASAIDYANIGSNYREMGKNKEAMEYYEAALALDPSIEFARESLARLRNQSL
ncbi:MAG: YcaO-like family protein [Thermodesulfobacteriota bacterium]|nr:YcaO-like family protein [Thermodesulfobacteriota bacterium]